MVPNRDFKRFPEDFMFQLTWDEVAALKSSLMIPRAQTELVPRSQFVIFKKGNNIKHLPYAFTEQGVAMLSVICVAIRQSRRILKSCALLSA
jgi:hypothetical protein